MRPQAFALLLGIVLVLSITPDAIAESGDFEQAALKQAAPPDETSRKHLVYVELFGKLGLGGLGYEFAIRDWLSVGGTTGVWSASGRTVAAGALTVGIHRRVRGAHGLYAQLGPELVRESEPAVAGFSGFSTVGFGGFVGGGYEYRGQRWVLRSHVVATVGRGGVAPWAGLSLGVRL